MWGKIKDVFRRSSKEPLFTRTHDGDTEMQVAYQSAAATFDQLDSFVRDGKVPACCVKLRFKDPVASKKLGEERFLFLWVNIAEADPDDGDAFFGIIFEVPAELHDWYPPGKYVHFRRADFYDWFVNDQGKLYGGFTLRVQRSRLPDNQRHLFDEHTGVRQWMEHQAW